MTVLLWVLGGVAWIAIGAGSMLFATWFSGIDTRIGDWWMFVFYGAAGPLSVIVALIIVCSIVIPRFDRVLIKGRKREDR